MCHVWWHKEQSDFLCLLLKLADFKWQTVVTNVFISVSWPPTLVQTNNQHVLFNSSFKHLLCHRVSTTQRLAFLKSVTQIKALLYPCAFAQKDFGIFALKSDCDSITFDSGVWGPSICRALWKPPWASTKPCCSFETLFSPSDYFCRPEITHSGVFWGKETKHE